MPAASPIPKPVVAPAQPMTGLHEPASRRRSKLHVARSCRARTTAPPRSASRTRAERAARRRATDPSADLMLVTDASVDLVCLYVDANLPTATPSQCTASLVSAHRGATVKRPASALDDPGHRQRARLPRAASIRSSAATCSTGDEVTDRCSSDRRRRRRRAGDARRSRGRSKALPTRAYTALGVPATAAEGGDRFSFDPTTLGYAVGDEVHLRVEVSDPAQPAAACAPTDDVCAAASCVAAPATTCPRRATWDIEVR